MWSGVLGRRPPLYEARPLCRLHAWNRLSHIPAGHRLAEVDADPRGVPAEPSGQPDARESVAGIRCHMMCVLVCREWPRTIS